MTAFKPGDRVHVEYDATVSAVRDDHLVWFTVSPRCAYVEDCKLVPTPLAVGDVITVDDPEPPIGTVIRTGSGRTTVAARALDGMWYAPGETRTFVWQELDRDQRLTVLYVLDADR